MMELKGCIFDLDGVIVDTAKYHFLAWQRLAAEMGFTFTEHDNEALKGVSRMASLEILLGIGGMTKTEEQKTELATRKNNWYIEYISHMSPEEILPGSREMVIRLREAGIKTAIGSASKNAATIIDSIGMRNLFDVIVDGTMIHSAKPDPEVFVRGAAEMGLDPATCIVFEDARAGVEAALAAGMRCVGVGNPVTLAGAHLVVPDLKNITVEQLRNL